MHCPNRLVLFCIIILSCMLVPVVSAVDPLWTVPATTRGELSTVVISADGSTIIAGGDQLIALSRDGHKLWSGWSGTRLAISRDGNYLVTSRDTTVRMISGTGTMLWDESLTVPVNELAMLPDASLIVAAGGTRVRLINTTGSGFRQNTSIAASHIRFFPKGDQLVITTKSGVQTSNLTLFSEWADTNVSQDFVEVAADGSSFVSVTNNRIRMYTRDGNLKWDRRLPGGNALASAYSRDGSLIVIGKDDNTVQALDDYGTLLWTAHAAHWITSVAVSEDGNIIAAGSMDKTLSVYDRAGTKLGSFSAGNALKAHSVAMSGDGSVIAAVDESAVYVFSRSQFTQPVPTATTTTELTVPETPSLVETTVAATLPTTDKSRPETPQAFISPVIPFLVFLLLVCRSRNS